MSHPEHDTTWVATIRLFINGCPQVQIFNINLNLSLILGINYVEADFCTFAQLGCSSGAYRFCYEAQHRNLIDNGLPAWVKYRTTSLPELNDARNVEAQRLLRAVLHDHFPGDSGKSIIVQECVYIPCLCLCLFITNTHVILLLSLFFNQMQSKCKISPIVSGY